MKIQLQNKRRRQKENNSKQLMRKLNEFGKHGRVSGIWKAIIYIRKTIHLMELKNYMITVQI